MWMVTGQIYCEALKFTQIHPTIWTNIFWNLHKYTCRSEQIHFASLNKCVLQIATGMQAGQYGNLNCNVMQCYNLNPADFDSEKEYFSRQTHSASFTACTAVHTGQLKRKFDCSDCFCPPEYPNLSEPTLAKCNRGTNFKSNCG